MNMSWRLIGSTGIIIPPGRLDKDGECIAQRIQGDEIELREEENLLALFDSVLVGIQVGRYCIRFPRDRPTFC